MILYRGSYMEIAKPDIMHSRSMEAIDLYLHFEGGEQV